MKYFRIQHSTNLKEVGLFPQCTDAKNYTEIQEFGLGYFDKISNPFLLPQPILRNKSKLTDLLNVVPVSSPVFLVLSDDLLNFIIPRINVGYQRWKLTSHGQGEIITKYNLFHKSNPSERQLIDFKNSEFILKNNETKKEEKVSLSNYNEFHENWMKLIYSNHSMEIKSVTLDLQKFTNDVFRIIQLYSLGIGYYVSEKLKNEIQNKGFTGIQFSPLDEIDTRIKVIY